MRHSTPERERIEADTQKLHLPFLTSESGRCNIDKCCAHACDVIVILILASYTHLLLQPLPSELVCSYSTTWWCNMESSLKRVLDCKLLFDILADSNGLVKLQTLEASWPSDLSAPMLPRGCVEFWREYSTSDGYLDWEMFSGGLEKALQADSFRLNKKEPLTEAEQRLKALRSEVAPLSKVKAADIEGFLASCKPDVLVQALARTRKEVFRCQASLHTLTSPTATTSMRRNEAGKAVK